MEDVVDNRGMKDKKPKIVYHGTSAASIHISGGKILSLGDLLSRGIVPMGGAVFTEGSEYSGFGIMGINQQNISTAPDVRWPIMYAKGKYETRAPSKSEYISAQKSVLKRIYISKWEPTKFAYGEMIQFVFALMRLRQVSKYRKKLIERQLGKMFRNLDAFKYKEWKRDLENWAIGIKMANTKNYKELIRASFLTLEEALYQWPPKTLSAQQSIKNVELSVKSQYIFDRILNNVSSEPFYRWVLAYANQTKDPLTEIYREKLKDDLDVITQNAERIIKLVNISTDFTMDVPLNASELDFDLFNIPVIVETTVTKYRSISQSGVESYKDEWKKEIIVQEPIDLTDKEKTKLYVYDGDHRSIVESLRWPYHVESLNELIVRQKEELESPEYEWEPIF